VITLADAQDAFQQHLLGLGDASGLLVGSAARRRLGLDIYANAYRRRLVEALADAHAKTRAWMGEERFDDVALAYVEAHVPTTRNLRWYGADFADALPLGCPNDAALVELAQLDWALRSAFDGADSHVLTAADLGGIAADDWATLHLRPVPTARLLTCRYNAVAVWQALDDERAPPPAEQLPEPVVWLVWRKQWQPHFRSLRLAEAVLLQTQWAGASFAEGCVAAQAQVDGLDAEQIGACLRKWLDDGLIAAVQCDPAPA